MRRWRKILEEATRQCGRADVPRLHEPRSLRSLLDGRESGEMLHLIAHVLPTPGVGLEALLGEAPRRAITLAVGPEGGFAPGEVAEAQAAGFAALDLGRRVLRAETAGLAALTAVRFAQGELG